MAPDSVESDRLKISVKHLTVIGAQTYSELYQAAPGTSVGEFEWLTAGDYDDLIKFVGDNGFDGPGEPGNGGAHRVIAKASPRTWG